MTALREAAGAPFGANHKSRVAHPLRAHRKGWAYHGLERCDRRQSPKLSTSGKAHFCKKPQGWAIPIS
jgi:hypothetical protein